MQEVPKGPASVLTSNEGLPCSDSQRCGLWETAGVPEVQAVGGLVFRTCLLTLLPPLLQLNGGGLGLCLVLLFCHSGAVLLTYLIAQIPRLGQYRFLSQASRVGPGKLSFQYTSTVYFVKHSSRANRAEAILWEI